jgi:signal transduction histidine kinase
VTVSDTGAGLGSEEFDRIFEEFYQSEDSRKAGIQGTGLGLNVTRRIVNLHGGRVWAASPGKGRGSQFLFEIPAQDVPAGRPADRPDERERTGVFPCHGANTAVGDAR